MKGKNWIDIGVFAIKTIISCIFLGFLIFAIYFIISDKAPLYDEPGSVCVLTDWVYYDQKKVPQKVVTPCVLDVTGRDTFTFETTLPENLKEDSIIAFLNLCDIDIYINDEPFYSWRRDSVKILGGPAKNSYFFIDIPSEYEGAKIKFVRYGTYNKKWVEMFVGPKDAVIRKIQVKNGIPNFALALFMLILSFLVIIGSIILRVIYKQRIHLIYISTGIFVTSCWLVFDSFLFQFFFETRFIDGLMSYVSTLSIIFAFVYYLDGLQENRFRKVYFFIGLVELINQILFISLHITGILNISKALVPLDSIIGLGIVGILIVTIVDLKKNNAGNYRICVSGFVVFMLCCVLEIVLINMVPERVQGTFILIGLYLLMGFAIVQEFMEIRKIQHERDTATANANARTQFLANMSHEIRTPINSILGLNEIISKETNDPKIASYSKIVGESGELLLSLVNDILDFSKMDSGKHETVIIPYHPKKLMKDLCSIIKDRAKEKNLSADISISNAIPDTLLGDSKALSQVLLNLLSNAVKYTNTGGISFNADCRLSDKCVLNIKVSDTGIGIKSEDIRMIFDPFSRIELKRNQNIQGTGLGLAITKQLVEGMGGSIHIESDYGVGTTFFVSIPQDIPSQSDIPDMDATLEIMENIEDNIEKINETYTAPGANVLVVDDNSTNQIVVKSFLKNLGLNLDIASGGLEAVEKCCKNKYDVIFMDHMMPECDGIEAMHMIKENSGSINASTPIIILTANALKGSQEQYVSEGFDNYLSKPVESARLKKMLRMYLSEDKVIEG